MAHQIPNENDPRVVIEFNQSTQNGREAYRVYVCLPIGDDEDAEGIMDRAMELAEAGRRRALSAITTPQLPQKERVEA